MKAFRFIFLSLISFILSGMPLRSQNEFDGKISIDRTIYNFGDILETDGPQKCAFTIKNISNEPVVIHRVVTSCGCTEPQWSKEPIRPGDSGTINVTYKNDSGPYPFDKSVTAYITGIHKPVILRIKGIVHEKPMKLSELFPFRRGPLSFREELPDIGQVEQGMIRNEEFEVANTTSKPLSVEFTNSDPGFSLALSPNPLPPGAKGTLTCSVNTAQTNRKLWGRTIFTATAREKGNSSNEGKISIKLLIKENFNSLTESQKNSGSLIKFAETSLSFGTVKQGTVHELEYDYTNEGRSPLVIYKIDSSEKGTQVTFPPEVKQGEKGRIHLTIDTGNCPKGEMIYIMTVVTNSPLRPLATFFATGTIE